LKEPGAKPWPFPLIELDGGSSEQIHCCRLSGTNRFSSWERENLVLDEGTAIVAPEPLQGIARYLQQVLLEESGLSLPIAPHGAGKAIRLSVKPDLTGIGSEGYLFTAGPAGVEIAATTEAGVFYGVQTLRQLLPWRRNPGAARPPTIPCLEIRDVPVLRGGE